MATKKKATKVASNTKVGKAAKSAPAKKVKQKKPFPRQNRIVKRQQVKKQLQKSR